MPLDRNRERPYDELFFEYIECGARHSAEVFLPIIRTALAPRTVLDVGCGRGAWLATYRAAGLDVLGLDGAYVDPRRLLIPRDLFRAIDVSRPFTLERTFDLVQSLEVAEHIPPNAGATFIDNLTCHATCVLFSAAVPGQGGEHHINERPFEYWRALFRERDFVPFDVIRPRIHPRDAVEPWYAYNALLYVRADRVPSLPSWVQEARILDSAPIPDVSPTLFRVRTAILKRLPAVWVTRLAVFKHHLASLKTRTLFI